MRVLLHTCCGPCLLEPIDALADEGHDIEIVYANPNIHPAEEYALRRDTLLAYARERGWAVRELPYDPDCWDRAVAGLEGDPARRCRACYELRLGLVAAEAATASFDAIATTLTVSPYQDPDGIRAAGMAAAEAAGVRYLDRDYRDRYSRATTRSRELGMYRQNYCGCVYSKQEAQRGRDDRRARRKAERAGGSDGTETP
ncbi:MAG: epoxyqueuosine reductase QueH [Coriobacteriia bacterium]